MNRNAALGVASAALLATMAACGTRPSAGPDAGTGGSRSTDGGGAAGGNGTAGTTGRGQTAGSGKRAPAAPAPDQTALQPGTNHNVAAAAYTKKASEVQAWLRQGSKAPNYPDHKIAFLTFEKTIPIAKRAIAEGNAINAHSASHNYTYLYPSRTGNKSNILADYAKAEDALKSALGTDFTNHGIRYPGGHMSWKGLGPADQALADEGLSWIDWDTMTGDAEPPKTHPTTPQGMVAMVQQGIKEDAARNPNVAVILMHDAEDKKMTHDALPQLVEQLRQEGYEFDVID